MDTVLERQRHAHEEIERLEAALADRFLAHPRTIRDRLQIDHEMADMLERLLVRSRTLRELYEDHDQARVKEVAELSAAGGLDNFYKHFSTIKDFHQRYPDNTIEDFAAQYELDLPDPTLPVDPDDRIAKMFSGEESYGRYFDLVALHKEFVNLKRNRQDMKYLVYLHIFDSFDADALPKYVKHDPNYGPYLSKLLDYLISFYKRTVPLDEHDKVLAELRNNFDEEYKTAQKGTNGDTTMTDGAAPVDEGIWCDICQKQYSKQTVFDGHLNSKKHKAGLNKLQTNGAAKVAASAPVNGHSSDSTNANSKKEIARKEWMISKLGLKFNAVKAATKANVDRKSTLQANERLEEQEAADRLTLLPAARKPTQKGADGNESDDSDSDKSDKPYNPLNLPMGWDGKPIPFWLYRLHGLGIEYPCEICGNYVYKGRKAYDKHFNESRHVHGLKCLGINGAYGLYDQIPKIEQAVALHTRIEEERRREEKMRDDNVEMEDDYGNVMNAKVYKDLVDQGIL